MAMISVLQREEEEKKYGLNIMMDLEEDDEIY